MHRRFPAAEAFRRSGHDGCHTRKRRGLRKIDLNAVAVAYDMEISTEFGYNKLHIEHDGISVIDADCRDHICMSQGKVSKAGVPIVCLPHKLTVEIEGGDIDA